METLHRLVKDKIEELKFLTTINAEDVTEIETMINSVSDGKYTNYITGQIPIEKFSSSRTTVNYEATMGLLANLLKETELAPKLQINSLASVYSINLVHIEYFEDIKRFLLWVNQLTEEQVKLLMDFNYVEVNELGEFVSLGNRVSIIKALLETDLRQLIPFEQASMSLSSDYLKAAIVGSEKDENYEITKYHINCDDNAIDILKYIEKFQQYLQNSGTQAAYDEKVFDRMTLLTLPFNTDLPIGYTITIEDILWIKSNISLFISNINKVINRLNNFKDNIAGSEYIKCRINTTGNIGSDIEYLYNVYTKRPMKGYTRNSNLTLKILRK